MHPTERQMQPGSVAAVRYSSQKDGSTVASFYVAIGQISERYSDTILTLTPQNKIGTVSAASLARHCVWSPV